MTFDSSGLLVGVPHQTGTFAFTVRARDVLNTTVSRSVTLTVVAPAILGLPPSPIQIGRPFSHTFTTTPGRIGSVKFERLTGFLPTGLSLSTAGLLSGTPTATGTYRSVIVATFTVGVPPVATFQDYKEITITVVPPPPVPTTKAPVPSTGTPNTSIPTQSQASSTSPGPTGSTVTTPGNGGQVPTARATSPAPGAEALAETGRTGGVAGWLCLVLTVIAAVAALLVWLLRRRQPSAGPAKSP